MHDELKEIAAQFDVWNAAIQTGDPDRVVELYAFNGILIPTLSNEIRSGHAEVRDYFLGFLKKKPRAQLDESYIRKYGDSGLNSGLYSFFFGNEKTPVQCRYSYIYNWHGDRWLIIEHHSSLLYKEHDHLKDFVAEQFVSNVISP